MLTPSDIEELTAFRRELHRQPELSGEEQRTARTIRAQLERLSPTRIIGGLGGHGIAAVFDSGQPGPTVLFRAELDALPIHEISTFDWASEVPGKGHLCGHDGHMTMLLALGRLLQRRPPARGRAVLMFQPAEEDGTGARAVVADPAFAQLTPDFAFAIHNEPGRPFGHVSTRVGLMNCASLGLAIHLSGKTAHAADPQDGVSPVAAVAALVPQLDALGEGGTLDETFRLATITHVNVGEATFGVAPGDALVHVTLRATRDEALRDMTSKARTAAERLAEAHGLGVELDEQDVFAATVNDAAATAIAREAMDAAGVPHDERDLPMKASEDFGEFGHRAKACMMCLGPGENYAALHNPDYDFPDSLIPIGTDIFDRVAERLLG